MEAAFFFLLSIQLAMGPFVWASELFHHCFTPPQVVDLSELKVFTTTDQLSGDPVRFAVLPEPTEQPPLSAAFDRSMEILFAPTSCLVTNCPAFEEVVAEIVGGYLAWLELPDLYLVESEER